MQLSLFFILAVVVIWTGFLRFTQLLHLDNVFRVLSREVRSAERDTTDWSSICICSVWLLSKLQSHGERWREKYRDREMGMKYLAKGGMGASVKLLMWECERSFERKARPFRERDGGTAVRIHLCENTSGNRRRNEHAWIHRVTVKTITQIASSLQLSTPRVQSISTMNFHNTVRLLYRFIQCSYWYFK